MRRDRVVKCIATLPSQRPCMHNILAAFSFSSLYQKTETVIQWEPYIESLKRRS